MGTDNTQSWQVLNGLAASGQLELDASVRDACAKACDDLRQGLKEVRDTLSQVNFKLTLGKFSCPKPLEDALYETVMGDDGFHARLKQHMDIAQEIADTIRQQVTKIEAHDQAHSDAIQTDAPAIVTPMTVDQQQAATQGTVSDIAIQMQIYNATHPTI